MQIKIYIYLAIACLIFTIIISLLNMILPDTYTMKSNFFKAAIILDISVILLIIVSFIGSFIN